MRCAPSPRKTRTRRRRISHSPAHCPPATRCALKPMRIGAPPRATPRPGGGCATASFSRSHRRRARGAPSGRGNASRKGPESAMTGRAAAALVVLAAAAIVTLGVYSYRTVDRELTDAAATLAAAYAVVALLCVSIALLAARIIAQRGQARAERAQRAELERARDVLARQAERLRILHEIDRKLIEQESTEAIAAAVLPPLRELMGVPRAIVNLFDLAAG